MSQLAFEPDLVVDATDCIMGRVASEVASRALAGERIAIVNAEAAVITGRREDVIERYQTRNQLGSDRGPYFPKRPDGILKRAVRGMLPTDRQRGRTALSNVRVYVNNPFDEDGVVLADTSLDRLSNIRFIHLQEISEQLGADVTW